MLGAGDRAAAADRAGCVLGVVYGGGKMLITCDCTDPACDVAGCRKFRAGAPHQTNTNNPGDFPRAEALRLADLLDAEQGAFTEPEHCAEILRRLHAENERLRGLAKWASGKLFDAGDTAAADAVLDVLGDTDD